MRFSRVIVADLGASHIAAAAFTITRGRELTLEAIASTQLGTSDGEDREWMHGLTEAMPRLLSVGAGNGSVAVAIPGHLALVKWLKTPAIPRAQRARVIAFDAAQNIPYPLSEVVWDHQLVNEEGDQHEFVLAAVKADAIAAICGATDAGGCRARRATPAIGALYDAFRYCHPGAGAGSLILDLGARTTHVLLIDGNRMVGRTLPTGGNVITQTIANELGISFEAAESLKVRSRAAHEVGQSGDEVVNRALQSFVLKLQAEVIRTMVSFRRAPGAPPPARVYLTGGTARFETVPALLGERLGLPTERFSALNRVHVAAGIDETTLAQCGGLAQLIGLAAQELNASRPRLNLLPLRLKRAQSFRQRQPGMLAAAVLGIAALVPPLNHFKSAARLEQRERVELERQVAALRAAGDQSAARIAELEHTNILIGELQSLVDRKSSWLRFFADTQQRLGSVEDVWLESLFLVRESGLTSATRDNAVHASSPLKLGLTGRLLDRSNPISKVSADSYERVKLLIAHFADSPFVASVAQERFDNSQPGILRFDFTLIVGSNSTL
ncbi:MAG: pilus assembly protein PilM [Opitutus sp.]